MRIEMTIQMHLEDVENYNEEDMALYESILNQYLESTVYLEKMENLDNPSGPDFTFIISGRLTDVLKDIETLIGESIDSETYREIERIESRGVYQDYHLHLNNYYLKRLMKFLENFRTDASF